MSDEPFRDFDDLPGDADDDLPADEVVYEPFEDVWPDTEDLEAIDLDALDDAIPSEEDAPDELTGEVEDLFGAMDALDDTIPEEGAPGNTSEDVPPSGGEPDTPQPDETRLAGPAAAEDITVIEEAKPAAEEKAVVPEPTHPPAPIPTAARRAGGAWVDAAEEPAPPDIIFDVLLALPPDLGAQVLELRTTGEIDDMPPPGVALHAAFRATDRDALEEALADWTRANLPVQIELTGIEAEIVGTQQYVAAWTLDPAEELQEAQHELRRALAGLATPLPDAPVLRQVRVLIGDHVAARRYPYVIGQMQRDFDPYVWHATELLLVERDASAPPEDWTISRTFD